MSQQSIESSPRRSLPLVSKQDTATPIVSDVDVEKELEQYAKAERERLGIQEARRQWVDSMIDTKFTKKERANVTLLISGLTGAQDFLCEGALKGVGYNVENIGCPDNDALQHGKEYGNRGQCNPTYFTVGNLVKKLCQLRDEEGMTAEEVVKNYCFLTAGACGPCRFGMYVTEYRKALRDAGFDGFRVLLFQQKGGIDQATGEEAGLELNPDFFLAVVKAIVCGDVLNALGYRIRPYEVEPGATTRAMEESKRQLYKALLLKKNIFVALYKCRKLFQAIKVDKLRSRAKVSIIGEFWAMTTEGDGNYHLQHFLESEGAENNIQLTTAWLLYNLWEVRRDTQHRAYLRGSDDGEYGLEEFQGEFDVAKRIGTLNFAEALLRTGFQMFALPLGLHGYHLPDMLKIAEVSNDFYSNDLRGGEGHMEVGKLICNVVGKKAHMTLSVKPFGCMPSSSVSDGVQSLITTKFPGSIYCAVETSGDGATNFYSRVQMYMYKARIAAEQELEKTFEDTGVTRQQVEKFLAENPEYASPLHEAPHTVCGSAANLVHEVAPLIKMTAAERRNKSVSDAAKWTAAAVGGVPGRVAKVARTLTDPEVRERIKTDAEIVMDLARGKANTLYGPLVKRLMGKAYYENNREVNEIPGMSDALAAE